MSPYISIANEFLFISFRLFYWFQKNIRISILSNMYFLVDWKQFVENHFSYFKYRQWVLIFPSPTNSYLYLFVYFIDFKRINEFQYFPKYVFFSRLKVIAEYHFSYFKYRQWVLIFPSPTNSYLYLFVYFIDFKRIYEFQYFQICIF